MKGLSLTPPWPFAILRCGKTIENREAWRACSYRGPIALHASGLPGPVASWWKRARLEASFSPRTARGEEALDDFTALARDCAATAAENGIACGPITRRELCAMSGHIVGVSNLVGVVPADGPNAGRVVLAGGHVRDLTDAERRWWFGEFARAERVPRARQAGALQGSAGALDAAR